jgi:hypothetical protein
VRPADTTGFMPVENQFSNYTTCLEKHLRAAKPRAVPLNDVV